MVNPISGETGINSKPVLVAIAVFWLKIIAVVDISWHYLTIRISVAETAMPTSIEVAPTAVPIVPSTFCT